LARSAFFCRINAFSDSRRKTFSFSVFSTVHNCAFSDSSLRIMAIRSARVASSKRTFSDFVSGLRAADLADLLAALRLRASSFLYTFTQNPVFLLDRMQWVKVPSRSMFDCAAVHAFRLGRFRCALRRVLNS